MATVMTHMMSSSTSSRFMGGERDDHETDSSADTYSSEIYVNGANNDNAPESEGSRADGTEPTERDTNDGVDDYEDGPSPENAGEMNEGLNEAAHNDGDEDTDQGEDGVISHPKPKARANKRKKRRRRRTPLEAEDDEASPGSSVLESTDDSSSEADEWHAEEEEAEDAAEAAAAADGNRCTFCNQLEDEDPSEEFELILTCNTCGENAHRQCAREANSLHSEDEAEKWNCPDCVEDNVEPTLQELHKLHRQSSAPKIARDLLPAQRAVKVGSHSVFNTLILDDDPMDGSRSLRKRKTSNEMEVRADPRKRLRHSSGEGPPASVDVPAALEDEPNVPTAVDSTARLNDISAVEETPRSRSSRLRQQKRPERPHVTVLENSELRYLISISIKPALMYKIVDEAKKRKRRARDDARRQKKIQELEQIPLMEVSHYPAIQSASFTASALALQEREGSEIKAKPYGAILTEAEADNSRTFPQPSDRKKFEQARLKAEDDWRRKIAAAAAEQARITQKVSGPPTRIKCIQFGSSEIDTWHAAPYPEEYSRNRVLYICEFCLKYMNSDFVAWRHKLKCPARHPPGDEIYHDGSFSFFEVDGRKNPVYCQNLCLLAKLFLGSKTLYYDVEPFLFYVMTENNEEGCHFVGYFSKEKRPSSQNNVSCILVLPIHQRRGFGHMLIEFSYLLTRVEGKTGSPEKPLSDMGLVSYRNYWRRVLCEQLADQKGALSISDISDRTGMTADDIVCALEGLRAIVRDPVTKTYALRLDYPYLRQYIDSYEKKSYTKINPDALTWVPYIMGRDNSHYENTHIQTVAQRGDDVNNSPPRIPEEGVQLRMNGLSNKHVAESKSGESAMEISTHGEEAEPQETEGRTTPFPSFDSNSSRQGSPAKRSRTATNNPSTPQAEFGDPFESPIPPTRFEVFPPLPGSSARKKSSRGWPRGAGRRGTPLRRDSTSNLTPDMAASTATPGMRSRSKLADMTTEPSNEGNEVPDDTQGIEGVFEADAEAAEASIVAHPATVDAVDDTIEVAQD